MLTTRHLQQLGRILSSDSTKTMLIVSYHMDMHVNDCQSVDNIDVIDRNKCLYAHNCKNEFMNTFYKIYNNNI